MFVVLVMGLFHWILLCPPDTLLMASMFRMYLLGAVVWMTLILLMIPSIRLQTLVLMMILMGTMVIPTLCQPMDNVSVRIRSEHSQLK